MMKWIRLKLLGCLAERRARRQLLAMDERMLRDLAISRVDAEQLAGCYKMGKTGEMASFEASCTSEGEVPRRGNRR